MLVGERKLFRQLRFLSDLGEEGTSPTLELKAVILL